MGVSAATVAGARSPSHEIQQIYYLGVFDPQDQVPPTVYRVRVHGQASFISWVNFASGWVPADLVDSLGSNISFEKSTQQLKIDRAGSKELVSLQTGRRLVLFGPEGFREAPRNHRLVVVMGSSPEKFFQAIDQSLGEVSQAIEAKKDSALNQKLFAALMKVSRERERLDELIKDIELELAEK
ncbi:MAG: hypothetical protein AB1512_27845 [Thermodesulfobacteriota bacterium]